MTKKNTIHTLFLLIILLVSCISSRVYSQDSLLFTKKAYVFIAKGDNYKSCYSYNAAINQYQKALKIEPDNHHVKLRIANSYRLLKDHAEAEKWYSCLENESIQYDPDHIFNYAMTLLEQDNYKKARKWFFKYNDAANNADSRAKKYIQSINNLSEYYSDSSIYLIKNLSFNTEFSDFCPINIQQKVIFLTSAQNQGDEMSKEYYDVYYTSIDKAGEYSKPKPFNKLINSKYHEGPLSFDQKGNKIYFTRNKLGPDESPKELDEIKLGIFYADYPESWNQDLEIKPLNFEGFKNNMGHPAITDDCKKMVFVSDAPGGYGGLDLYMSVNIDNVWQYPVNLGPKINTKGDEMFPAFWGDNILYFSSDGHGGLGGLDVYRVKMDEDFEVKNLKYPINSSSDDFGITFSSTENVGYFTSNRSGGKGKDDIYSFELVKIKFSGSVFDIGTRKNIEDAKIILRNKQGIIEELISDAYGQFDFIVEPGSEYSIEIEKTDFSKEELELQIDSIRNNHIGIVQIGLSKNTSDESNVLGDTDFNNEMPNTETDHSSEKPDKSLLLNGTQFSELEQDSLHFDIRFIIKQDLNLAEKQPIEEPTDPVVEVDKNIKYRVQIAACRNPLTPKDIASKYKGDKDVFMFEEDGWYKYAIAEELTYYKAKEILADCKVDDAFIAAYTDSEKLTLKQAISEQYSHKDKYFSNNINITNKIYEIKTIPFDFNSYILKKEYREIINSDVVSILNSSDTIGLKIRAHTDIRGSNEYNLGLSTERAEEISDYLVRSGIRKDKIEIIPLGESMVPEKCEIEIDCNESIHSKNRIAELIIVHL